MKYAAAAIKSCSYFHEYLYLGQNGRTGQLRHPSAARSLQTVCFALPFFLFVALLASGKVGTGLDMVMAGLSLCGFVLLICAGLILNLNARVLALSALALYGSGLVFVGLEDNSANMLIWLLVLAVPLEGWLMGVKRLDAAVSVILSAVVLSILLWQAQRLTIALSPELALLSLAYIGTLLWRLRAPINPIKQTQSIVEQTETLEKAFGGLGFHLDKDGMITGISDHSAQMLGLKRDVLLNTLLLDRIHISDRIHYLSLLADIRAKASDSASCHVRIRNVVSKDDNSQTVEHRFFRIHATWLKGEAQAETIYLTATDSTLEHEQAAQLLRAQDDLKEMAASRRHALASVSHELRNPLNAIIGFSDLLLHEMGCRFENEKQREYSGLIQRSGLYLLDIVNTILDASKIEAGTYQIMPKDFSIREAVDLSMNILATQAEHKQVILSERIHGSIGTMIADQRAVQQILINLMANAVKFTPKGGCVTLDGFKDQKREGQMVFIISDNGVGIAEEDIEHLGQPFTQLSNSAFSGSEGAGLGLSLVKALVEKHEGQFEITSCLGKGTIVTIRLPLAGPKQAMNLQQQEAITQAEKEETESVTVLNINRLQIGRRYVRQEEKSGEKKQSQQRKIA